MVRRLKRNHLLHSVFSDFRGRLGEVRVEKLNRYLEKAADYRRLAETAALPDMREEFLVLAETWDRLADIRRWLLQCRSRNHLGGSGHHQARRTGSAFD